MRFARCVCVRVRLVYFVFVGNSGWTAIIIDKRTTNRTHEKYYGLRKFVCETKTPKARAKSVNDAAIMMMINGRAGEWDSEVYSRWHESVLFGDEESVFYFAKTSLQNSGIADADIASLT